MNWDQRFKVIALQRAKKDRGDDKNSNGKRTVQAVDSGTDAQADESSPPENNAGAQFGSAPYSQQSSKRSKSNQE